MTKITQAEFEADTITKVEEPPKVKTRVEKLQDWRKQNEKAYVKACDARCMCSPSRADLMLIDQYEGYGPSDL